MLILASISSMSSYLANYIDNYPILSKVSGNNTKAIFYIIGEYSNDTTDIFEDFPLNHFQYARALANAEFDWGLRLSNLWGWDFFGFYGCIPRFERYEYDTLLLFFHGHGNIVNNEQLFAFDYDYPLEVESIPKRISCNNLTAVVLSCYGINWQNDFHHDNLHGLYTNDLENDTVLSGSYCSNRLDTYSYVFKARNYNIFFIDALLYGQSFEEANKTAIDVYYEEF